MIIKLEPSPKVSDYPELVEIIERYKTRGNKKPGPPKKASTALHPNLRIAMPSLLLNENCDLDLFWDVFYEAAWGHRTSQQSQFNEWQQEIDQIKRAAEQEKDAAIKLANQQYENTLAQEVRPLEVQLDQMKHLADAVVDMLPKEKLAEFFRQVAKQKAKGGHWCKKLQLKMGCEYRHQGGFYGALSQWIKDKYGMDYPANTVRKYVQREFKKLQQE